MRTKIGVIAIQSDVAEHIIALEKTLAERGEKGEVVKIKQRGIVDSCDAIVIPGGESTTIGRLIEREGIHQELKEAVTAGKTIALSSHPELTEDRRIQHFFLDLV